MNIYIKICTDLTVLQLIGFFKEIFYQDYGFFFVEVTIYYLVYASKQVELDTSLKWNMYQGLDSENFLLISIFHWFSK